MSAWSCDRVAELLDSLVLNWRALKTSVVSRIVLFWWDATYDTMLAREKQFIALSLEKSRRYTLMKCEM